MQKRWKSRVVWISVFSLLGFILKNYAVLDILQLTSDEYNYIVDTILGIFVLIGVLNDPTNKYDF